MPMYKISENEEISQSLELSEFQTDIGQIFKEEVIKQIVENEFLTEFNPNDQFVTSEPHNDLDKLEYLRQAKGLFIGSKI